MIAESYYHEFYQGIYQGLSHFSGLKVFKGAMNDVLFSSDSIFSFCQHSTYFKSS